MIGPTELILQMFRAALKAADPAAAVAKAINCRGREVTVGGQHFEFRGESWRSGWGRPRRRWPADRPHAAARLMADCFTKDGHGAGAPGRFEVREASHPIPDERGVAATRAILDLVQACKKGDVVVALISGGGSALLEAPRPPLTLDDLAQTTDLLLRAGAPIQDLNTVRIPLSLVKEAVCGPPRPVLGS